MFSYLLLALSLLAAVVLLAAGINRTLPPVIDDANAQACCWAPRGENTRCYPCRPTRDTQTTP